MVTSTAFQTALLVLALSGNKSLDSIDLAHRIKAGNHKAFQDFFDAHYDSLYRFIVSKHTSPEAAKDLIQKAFVYIWEHRQNIDPQKSLRAYLFKIGYTRMLNHHRNNKKFNDEVAVPEQESTLTPEDQARANDLQCAIDRAINQMPEKRGAVFQLCFMEDLTYKEAARVMEVSPKTIENHMGLAFKDMRKALRKFR